MGAEGTEGSEKNRNHFGQMGRCRGVAKRVGTAERAVGKTVHGKMEKYKNKSIVLGGWDWLLGQGNARWKRKNRLKRKSVRIIGGGSQRQKRGAGNQRT